MKLATAYRRGSAVLVHPSARTTDGVWILSEPCVRLPSDCSDVELGDAVLSALKGSKSPLPHPTEWKGVLEPLLDAAGVRSWKTFAKCAACVEVAALAGELEFVPTENMGADEGFEANEPDKSIVTLPTSSEVVGATLRKLLASPR